ncbi:MAG: dicarboxylate/amino acid:cation symporter [Paraperlucidibaca sp.]
MSLTRQILIGLSLGLIAAALLAGPLAPWQDAILSLTGVTGSLFLNALKMVAVPLIATTLIAGLGKLDHAPGRLGALTASYYAMSTLLAVSMGLLLSNVIAPGLRAGLSEQGVASLLAQAGSSPGFAITTTNDWQSTLLGLVPGNIFNALSSGNLIAVVLFSLVLGLALRTLPGELRGAQQTLWDGLQHLLMTVTQWVLRAAPIGVFALVTTSAAQVGWSAAEPLAWFVITVLLALALHAGLSLGLILWRLARVSPLQHARDMSPALWMAFSTASSAATLPVTVRCLTERAKVSPSVTGLTVPLGTTMNMDGTALYECVAVLFLAQLLGADLTIVQQLLVLFLALATSTGMAGIPAASLVAIALILERVGLPPEALGLLLITDRPLDMCRTAVNVWSDSVAARLVAHYAKVDAPDAHVNAERES